MASSHPLLPKERWRIAVLQTPLQAQVGVGTEYAAYVPRLSRGIEPEKALSAIAHLYGADDVTAVRVRVERLLHRTQLKKIRLFGLRLIKRNGQTALVWTDATVRQLQALNLRIAPGNPGDFVELRGYSADHLKSNSVDRREPLMRFAPRPSGNAKNLSDEDPWLDNETLLAIEGPDLNHLNVQSLTIGSATWRSERKIDGPVDPRPFSIVLAVTKQWDENLGTFEASIPVQPAS